MSNIDNELDKLNDDSTFDEQSDSDAECPNDDDINTYKQEKKITPTEFKNIPIKRKNEIDISKSNTPTIISLCSSLIDKFLRKNKKDTNMQNIKSL